MFFFELKGSRLTGLLANVEFDAGSTKRCRAGSSFSTDWRNCAVGVFCMFLLSAFLKSYGVTIIIEKQMQIYHLTVFYRYFRQESNLSFPDLLQPFYGTRFLSYQLPSMGTQKRLRNLPETISNENDIINNFNNLKLKNEFLFFSVGFFIASPTIRMTSLFPRA